MCLHLSYHTQKHIFLFEHIIETYNLLYAISNVCWAHVWTIHHSPSMNICIPPGLLSAPHPFLLTDAAQCVLHHVTSELISPRSHKHDWFSPVVPAKRGQCAGFQKKIKNKRANVFFFGSRAVKERSLNVTGNPSNICLPSSVRSRFRAASERTESFRSHSTRLFPGF